jgi:hypothetical protein
MEVSGQPYTPAALTLENFTIILLLYDIASYAQVHRILKKGAASVLLVEYDSICRHYIGRM